MTRKYYAPKPFTVLVANPATGRQAFRNQVVQDEGGRARIALMDGNPARATGTITVADAGFVLTELYATGGFTVVPPLSAGVVITINGNALTGIAGARTPGADNFNVGATDVAAELVDAINDAANSFDGDVAACKAGNFVGLTAVTAGAGGNALTLATSDATQVSLSGATLLGGGQSAGQSTLHIGPFTLVTGLHWNPTVGDANASATALAAAINNLPGYSASALAAVVTVTGPAGADESEGMVFSARYEGVTENFTLSPDTGYLGGGAPSLGPPELL
jgi:hypothetical protein